MLRAERTEILRHFAQWSWAETARALIAIPERWLKWALYDRKTPFRRGIGPVTLIGDASHPMLPFLAQGAAMAIEDAAILSRAVELDLPLQERLSVYERHRAPRAARVVNESTEMAELYHISDASQMKQAFKDRNIAASRNNWLYPYDPLNVPLA